MRFASARANVGIGRLCEKFLTDCLQSSVIGVGKARSMAIKGDHKEITRRLIEINGDLNIAVARKAVLKH